MRHTINRFFLFLIAAMLFTQTASAQNADEQLVHSLRGGALFNVIIASIAIVLIGLLIAIIRLDRKVSKLEKEQQARQS
jgi:uncharacterized membrane protein YbjE (DUF340 family)